MYAWLTDLESTPSGAGPGEEATPDRFSWSRCPPISYAEITRLLVPEYIAAVPKTDGWGHPLEYCLRADGALGTQYQLGVRGAGRNGRFESDAYSTSPFPPTDVDRDVVWIDGFFVT